MIKKADLPTKICQVCKRSFSWRKKWEKVWSQVKYCSKFCARKKIDDLLKVRTLELALRLRRY